MGKIEITGILYAFSFFLTAIGIKGSSAKLFVIAMIVYTFIAILLAVTLPRYLLKKGILSRREAEFFAIILATIWIFAILQMIKYVKLARR